MTRTTIIDQWAKKMKARATNALTFGNLFSGGFATILILHGELRMGLVLVLLAALADRFDGKLARKFGTESEFGKQLDSMCDIVSFGVAPALLIYQAIIHYFSFIGAFFTVFFIACGVYRLVRFNLSEPGEYYTGLPITVAGSILSLCFLFVNILPPLFFFIVLILLSLFMVSPFSIKKI